MTQEQLGTNRRYGISAAPGPQEGELVLANSAVFRKISVPQTR
ncbi:hypothetical protein [Amycolatopsis regifaucium]|nr:hypothetical protein [Amycolatopsis regifaucium]